MPNTLTINLLLIIILISVNISSAQNLTGTWRGSSTSTNPPGFTVEFVTVIEQNGKKVKGTTTQKTISSNEVLKAVNCTMEWEGTFDGTYLKTKFKRFTHFESQSGGGCLSKGKAKYTNINGVEKLVSKDRNNGKYYRNGIISFNSACLGFKAYSTYIKDKTTELSNPIVLEDLTQELPDEYKDRTFNTTSEITVSKADLKISFWDKNKEDGDQISVFINKESILDKHTVTKKKETISYRLKKGDNYIIINADNLGKIEPNTAIVSIESDNKNLKDVNCRSNLDKSIVIKIIYK